MKEIIIAVIGCGRIAIGQHFPALDGIDGVRIKYACDIIQEMAQKMKVAGKNVCDILKERRLTA